MAQHLKKVTVDSKFVKQMPFVTSALFNSNRGGNKDGQFCNDSF